VGEQTFSWFDFAWPWIGLAVAMVLVVLLFATNLLRGGTTHSRWRDLRWLSFLANAAYLVHQFEEYGIAANGVHHAFPDALCSVLGQQPYPACGIPPLFYLAVNLPLVWVAAPLAALCSRRRPLSGLALWGVIAVNAIVHIGPSIATLRYGAGLVTAVVLFVPLTVVMTVALLEHYRPSAALVLFAAGAFMHAVLGGGVVSFLRGAVPAWLLIIAQPMGITIGFLAVMLAERRLRRVHS